MFIIFLVVDCFIESGVTWQFMFCVLSKSTSMTLAIFVELDCWVENCKVDINNTRRANNFFDMARADEKDWPPLL